MKIAIASTGNTLNDQVSIPFGRCFFFAFYDSEDHTVEFISNPYKDNDKEAGIAATNFIASHQVKKIIAGEFGIKIETLMIDKQIQMIVIREKKKVEDIIKVLQTQYSQDFP